MSMARNIYPSGHFIIAEILLGIANIRNEQGMYDESLELYQQAVTMLMNYYSPAHLDIVHFLNCIGDVQLHGKVDYEKAFDVYQQALTMLETYYPSYSPHIANCLNRIGNVKKAQNQNNEALDYYNLALKLQKDYFSSDHIQLTTTIINIAHIFFIQGNYDDSL
ncbi:unnamed protein product, partial [Adineta steineri]